MPHRSTLARVRPTVPIAVLALAAPAPALGVPLTFTGTLTPLTTAPSPQFDPRIDGDLVVYSDFSSAATGIDVVYVDLTDPSTKVSITGAGDQRLHDVSGSRIAYTDESAVPTSTVVHDVTDGSNVTLADLKAHSNPAISGDLVAFERHDAGTPRIATTRLGTGTIENVSASGDPETGPSVSGDVVVFSREVAPGDFRVIAYDAAADTETVVGAGLNPDLDGAVVVYQAVSTSGDEDVHVFDLTTSTDTAIVATGDQTIARISGDFLTYTDVVAGVSDIVVRHLPTGASTRIGFAGASNLLSDVSGNRVVFTSDIEENQDIWLYEFALVEAGAVPAPATAPLALAGMLAALGLRRRRKPGDS